MTHPLHEDAFGMSRKDRARRPEPQICRESPSRLRDRDSWADLSEMVRAIRTQSASGRPDSAAALSANDLSLRALSTVGDVEGSYRSLKNDIGSPGMTAAIPEPETYALFLAGLGLLGFAAKRRR